MSDDELDDRVGPARDGDRAALEGLLVSVQDDVHRLALRMTGSPDDALDATQEILIRVMTRLSTFKGAPVATGWPARRPPGRRSLYGPNRRPMAAAIWSGASSWI